MFQRCIRYSIPDTTNKLNHINLEERLEFNDPTKKEVATDYATLLRHTKPCSLSFGEGVLVKQPRKNKLSSQFNHTHIVSLLKKVRYLQPKTRKLIMNLLEIRHILSRSPNKYLHHLLY